MTVNVSKDDGFTVELVEPIISLTEIKKKEFNEMRASSPLDNLNKFF